MSSHGDDCLCGFCGMYSKADCVCVACGTQCEICLEPYPSACSCPNEEDCKVCNDPDSVEECIYHP